MVEYLIILVSLVIGIIIGWILKGRSQSEDNTELQSKINTLTDEKARAEARLEQLDEIKKAWSPYLNLWHLISPRKTGKIFSILLVKSLRIYQSRQMKISLRKNNLLIRIWGI